MKVDVKSCKLLSIMNPKYLIDAMLCDTLVSSSFRMRLLTFARRLLVANDRIFVLEQLITRLFL